jgi:undecaprenyl-diphosphatase
MNNYIFNFFYELSSIDMVTNIALFVSYKFIYILIIFLFVWAVFFTEKKMFTLSLFSLAGLTGLVSATIIKSIFQIARPGVLQGIIPRIAETGFSFPSQHATVFFSLAFVSFLVNRKLGFFLTFCAVMISISRMVLGVHYFIDIVGGMVLGLLVALFFIKIFRKIK